MTLDQSVSRDSQEPSTLDGHRSEGKPVEGGRLPYQSPRLKGCGRIHEITELDTNPGGGDPFTSLSAPGT